MKNNVLLVILIVLILSGCSCSKNDCKWSDEFLIDFPNFNYQLAGKLKLEQYDLNNSGTSDISGFTYDNYLNRCKSDSSYSLKGMYQILSCADMVHFESHTEYFTVVLFYNSSKRVIVDHSIGSFIDTTFISKKMLSHYELEKYAQLKKPK